MFVSCLLRNEVREFEMGSLSTCALLLWNPMPFLVLVSGVLG